MAAALSELGRHVRVHDPDRFYAALFAPAERREALFALLAFNHEIARVRDAVSEPQLGEMRLHWWQSALDGVAAGAAPEHPIAQALAAARGAQAFPLEPLCALIEARAFDLYDVPMADMAALEAYARATGGGLHRLLAEVLGADEPGLAAAEHAGTAWALTGILRALPIHAARGQSYIPQGEGGVPAAVQLAHTHYRQARTTAAGAALPAILAAALVPSYLRRAARNAHDPLHRQMELGKPERLARILFAALRNRI